MPVTAKLSKLFYDRLGEQIANELVDWFNQVDATYRADLRELNELNFARFDAKLEQRLAELNAKWGARWDKLDAKLEQRLAQLDAKWGVRWDKLDAKLEQRLAEFEATLERRLGEQTRWLFVAWASLLIPIIGLWIRG
jgi:hypothetical protein